MKRIPCLVPFCRRTTSERHPEWICAKHWPLVPRSLKAEYRTARSRVRRILRHRPAYSEYWKLPPGSPTRLRAVAMWRRLDQVWARCKASAIERAMGI